MQTFEEYIAANFPAAKPREKQMLRRVWDAAQAAGREHRAAIRDAVLEAARPTVTKSKRPPPPKLSEEGLERMTKAQLVSHAKLHGLTLSMALSKDEMIDDILADYLDE